MRFKLFFIAILGVFFFSGCIINKTEPQAATNSSDFLSANNSQILNEDINQVSADQEKNSESVKEEEIEKPNEILAEEFAGDKVKPKEDVIDSPKVLDYPVPFVSQAPFGVWDELHKEACEEASIIMVVKYFNDEPLTAHTMEQGIISLATWERENGYQVDINASEAVDIIKNHFNLKADLITDVTVDNIIRELKNGNLIIIPAAGRQLNNPYFQTPGPIYHMLVIKGYDQDKREFITNDVGTKRGEGFRYGYQALIDAIHDWDHVLALGGMTDDEMEQGRKVIISVSR